MNNSVPGAGAPGADRLRKCREIDRSAIDRGKALVRQILTFARKTPATFRPLQLNHLVTECAKMMTRTFPKTIFIRTDLRGDIPNVYADENQLSQVIMNLTLNARDAMPGGGEISLATGIESGTTLAERCVDARPVDYIRLSVTDTGAGMDEETLKKIFVPFFTTKGRGKGTGLGLAVVYGIVGSHQGYIETRSAPGRGTTMDVYIPATAEREISVGPAVSAGTGGRAIRGKVLIVEDEEMIVASVSEVLREAGYVCLAARDGVEGLESWKKNREGINVVLLDIDLPRMGGWDVLRKIREVDGETKVILCGGYLDPEIKNTPDGRLVNEYLAKPYSGTEVLESISRVLGRAETAA